MKINKLSVASFGKFYNRDILLNDGLNVVYGENESGKSTMLSYIRFMLFGNHGRRGTSNFTLEEKYQPWDNTAISGNLEYEFNGVKYTTYRSHGTRKEYKTVNDFGNPAFEGINPGESIYNMNESAFLRSFYLSATSCRIAADKNDDILRGLSNLADTGDDQLSYDRLSAKINADKKQIVSEIGSIDDEIRTLRESLERIGALKERSGMLNKKLSEADVAIKELNDNLDDKIDRNNRYQRYLEKYATTKLYQQARAISAVLLTILIVALVVAKMPFFAIPAGFIDIFTLLFLLLGKRKLKKLRRVIAGMGQDAKIYSDDVKSDITKNDSKKSEILKEIGAVESELDREYGYDDLCSQIEYLTEQKNALNKKAMAVEKARYILDVSYNELKNLFSPILNKKASQIFATISGKGDDMLYVSDSFDINVRDEHDFKSSQVYSAGTYEMMFLSLRLALCDILGGDEKLPIFLDDCFALCDDARAERAVGFLADYAKDGRQIVFCTCHKRELALFEKCIGVNIIKL